jgi:NADH dehydrogenase (ubiquinone) Fe-S protein 4
MCATDHFLSAYSPIPTFNSDRGPDDVLAANVISGAPNELQARTVRIFKPSKPASQSGNWNGRQWRMDWDLLSKGHRWENPLMGWQSSGDFMQGTHIFFKTKEDAINFAEKQGIFYYLVLIQQG